ncbi:hypothetical protein GCM10007874_15610 [Labrys miyagiensis]|uniref:Transposase n=1 Tax=Labrys miyagiensis TaxID=346912 RepID=A0ABQ6CFG9_9HYPH|nr:hypothetical protein GCM10007874_15610 [Labrys miyagiensis]
MAPSSHLGIESIWLYLRANWIWNRVFETYDDIIDAAWEGWHKLTDLPYLIASLGRRHWASIGQI